MTKRNLFAEITEGFEALADERAGKRTLRTYEVEEAPAPSMHAADIIAVRERLRLSRPLFARYLRTFQRSRDGGSRKDHG